MISDMEPETPQYLQYLEGAKSGVHLAQGTGLLKRLLSLVHSRRSQVQPAGQVDYRESAIQALRENAVETLENLELTASEASQILEPGFKLEDLDKVNSTWQRHWTGGTSKVGIDDGERRTWWARLLAGEMQLPGTFSLRTLAVMDTLSKREGELFTQVCQYIWSWPRQPSVALVDPALASLNPMLILPREESSLWRPSLEDSAILGNAGLVTLVANDVFLRTSVDDSEDESILLTFDSDTFLVNVPIGSVGLRCGNLLLTDAGKEIYRLTTPDYSQSYRDEIVAEWGQRYKVLRVSHTS